MTARPLRGGVAAVLIASFVWLAASAGLRPLSVPDEGRYVGVAFDMLQSGDWLVPRLDGLPFFHKPPLFYWITAASLGTFGANEWAARLASLGGASAAAAALWLFVRRWAGAAPIAWRSVQVLLTAPLFYGAAQFANLDMLVAGCIAGAVTLAAHAALAAHAGLAHRGALLLAYLAAALGVLAKGLIGGVLPVLVIGIWLIAIRRPRQLGLLVWPPGVLVFAAVAAPWFVAMQMRFPGFFDYFFMVQHVRRFAEAGFNNIQPFWFFPAVLALLALPWCAWLVRTVRRPGADGPNPGASGGATGPAAQPVRVLMWVWLVVVVGFFSLPRSKLASYVLPALPPLAFLVADGLFAFGPPSTRARRLWAASAVVAVGLCFAAVATFAIRTPQSVRDLAEMVDRRGGPDDALLFVGEYYYDAAFYARRGRPSRVVADWTDPAIGRHDNWRQELSEAGRFAPAAPVAEALLPRTGLAAALCAARVSWILAPLSARRNQRLLADFEPTAINRDAALWRLDASLPLVRASVACPERPNGGSTGKSAPPPP